MAKRSMMTADPTIQCPFTVLTDSREQQPYTFESIYGSAAQHYARVIVPTLRMGLAVGDYSIFGLPGIAIERKSKEDLYGSVARRENFIGRLERMSELTFALIMVEADYLDVLQNPPHFSKFKPRSLSATIIAWSIRYPVRWAFIGGRDAAERLTYRYLERYYLDHKEELSELLAPSVSSIESGMESEASNGAQ